MAAEGWISSNVDEVQAPAAKTRAVNSASIDKQRLETELNHKILSLQNAQMLRLLQATAWHSYIVPPQLLQGAIETNKKHADMTRGQSGHKVGPPHVQSYLSLLQSLIAMFEPKVNQEDGSAKAHLGRLQEHLQAYKTEGVDQGWKTISQLRVRITKDNVGVLNYQLSSMLSPDDRHAIEHALAFALQAIGGSIRPGGPPRSDTERKLQAQVDEIKQMLGKK